MTCTRAGGRACAGSICWMERMNGGWMNEWETSNTRGGKVCLITLYFAAGCCCLPLKFCQMPVRLACGVVSYEDIDVCNLIFILLLWPVDYWWSAYTPTSSTPWFFGNSPLNLKLFLQIITTCTTISYYHQCTYSSREGPTTSNQQEYM